MTFAVPGYDIQRILGRGGNAVVFRAWQRSVGRHVALKVGHRAVQNERDKRRFRREVTAAGLLAGHPYVVSIFDAGIMENGWPYLVMQYCPGGSLQERIGKSRFGTAEVREIGVRIADALVAAHEKNVLHRDVKPHNLLVTEYGHVALADFGVAAVHGHGGGEPAGTSARLTPVYAAPETYRGAPPSQSSDVYALAATLYAMAAGRPPRCPDRADMGAIVWRAEMMRLHESAVPGVPGLPSDLMQVLEHALSSEPAERLSSMARFRDALVTARLDPVSV